MASLRSPGRYPGGKQAIVHRILPLIPSGYDLFLEPYVGMGSVILNSPKRKREIANDSNPDVINFWKVFQGNYSAFREAILLIEHDSKEAMFREFNKAKCGTIEKFSETPHYTGDYLMDHAVAFLVRQRFSRAGDGYSFGWSDRLRRGLPEYISAWRSMIDAFPAIYDRTKDIEFRCGDAIKVLREFNDSGTVCYLDPPYVSDTRVSKDLYVHEMTVEQHEDLLRFLVSFRGAALLSGYPHPMYDNALVGWERTDLKVKCTASQVKIKPDRIESIWRNPVCFKKEVAA